MSDPVVSITGGVPTSGTGTISTLGQVVAPQGASTSTGESGTSGPIRGPMIQGATTTSAPTYTNGTVNPLTTDTSGNLRITVTNASIAVTGTFWQATQPVSQSGTWTVQPGNTANTTPWLTTISNGGISASTRGGSSSALSSDASLIVQLNPLSPPIGTSTQNSASVTNGVMALGQFNTAPTTITSGNMSPLQLDASGNLRVNVMTGGGGGGGTSSTFNATFPTTGTAAGGEYLSSPPTLTSGQMVALQTDVNGNLKVNIAGSITQATNVSQFGGSAVVTGTGISGAGIPRVTVSSDTLIGLAQGGNTAVIKGSSAQPATTDAALVVAVSPNTPALGVTQSGQYTAGSAWTSATGVNTTAVILNSVATNTYETINGQITQTTTLTAGAVTFEESFDGGTTFITIPPQRFVDPTTYVPLANPYTVVASTNQRFHIIPASTGQVRARLSTVITGTGSVTVGWTISPTAAVDLTNSICGGDAPQGNTDVGWPVKTGGVAKTTNPAAWTDGQRVAAVFDKQGKQIVNGAIRQLKGVQKTSITVATETTVVTAGAAGVFQDVHAIVVTNKSATAVFVDFRDATAGTVRMTLAAPASDTRGFTVPVDSAMVQAVAANNWTATVSSAVTSIEITVLYVSNL